MNTPLADADFTKKGLSLTKRSLERICSNSGLLWTLTAIVIMSNIPTGGSSHTPYQNEEYANQIADILRKDLDIDQCSIAQRIYCAMTYKSSCRQQDKNYVEDLSERLHDLRSRLHYCFKHLMKPFYGTIEECQNQLINYLVKKHLTKAE